MNRRFNIFKSVFARNMKWSFISTLLLSLLGLLYYVILTRFLAPADFGVFSVCLIFLGFMDFFAGFGMSAVIIQEKKVSKEQYSTFFWINLFFGIFLSLFIILIAPFIAVYFEEKSLTALFYIISAIPVINSLSLLHNNILRREIQIEKAEKAELAGTTIQLITGISLAFQGAGVYSLPVSFVLGKLTSGFVYMLYGWNYFKPSLVFNYQSVSKQLTFGKYQVLEKLFNYIRANSDKFLIGKFLGPTDLGYYTLAQKLVEFPLSKINPALNKILFPYFSRLQSRPKILSGLYTNVTTFLMVSVTPFLIFLLFFADSLVSLTFDKNYFQIGPLIQILSVLGLLRSFSNIGGNLLLALGNYKVGFVWNFWWAIIITGIIYTGFLFHANLVQITMIIFWANFVSFFIWHMIIHRYFHIQYKKLLFRLLSSLGLSTVFLLLLFITDGWLDGHVPLLLRLAVYLLIVSGTVAYIVFHFFLFKKKNMFTSWK